MRVFNVQREYVLGSGRWRLVIRAKEGAIGPGGDVTELFLRDDAHRFGRRGKLVKHLEISGEVKEEADAALVTLVELMWKVNYHDLGDSDQANRLYDELREQLYEFCGFNEYKPQRPSINFNQ